MDESSQAKCQQKLVFEPWCDNPDSAAGGGNCLLRSPVEGLCGCEFYDTQISFSDLHPSMPLNCAVFLQRLEFRYVFSYHGLERISY